MARYKWIDTALQILSYLRPKFYNRITWWVIGVGLGLLGAIPIFERILIALFDQQLSLHIPSDVSNIIGLILVIIGLIYNLLMKIVDNSYELGLSSKSSTIVQSDIKVYNRIMELLPYQEVESFAKYDFMGSFLWDHHRKIISYSEIVESPDLSFFNDELNTLKTEFDHALKKFSNTLMMNTFAVQGSKDVFKVPDDWKYTFPDNYKQVKKEIYESQDKFFESYNSLIKGCRKALGV